MKRKLLFTGALALTLIATYETTIHLQRTEIGTQANSASHLEGTKLNRVPLKEVVMDSIEKSEETEVVVDLSLQSMAAGVVEAESESNSLDPLSEDKVDLKPDYLENFDIVDAPEIPLSESDLIQRYLDFKEEVQYYDFNERFNLNAFLNDPRFDQISAKQGAEILEYVFQNLEGIRLLQDQPDSDELFYDYEEG